tara:strand:- start:167 stop:334 length:168 start_codon:yes stop_codon:yes gene_type:complete
MKGNAMSYNQMEFDLGNFQVLKAVRQSQEKRNEEARKRFFRFVKFNFRREKNDSK